MATPKGFVLVKLDDIKSEKKADSRELKSAEVASVADESKNLEVVPLLRQSGGRYTTGIGKETKGLPPPYEATVSVRRCFRYSSGASAAGSVDTTQILLSLGCMATTTTKVYSLYSSFRIIKMVVWCPAPGTSLGNVSLRWVDTNDSVGALGRDSRVEFTLPKGITQTGAITFRPPKGSDASFWHNGQVLRSLFAFAISEGAILDLHVEATLANEMTNVFQSGLTGLSEGVVYGAPLDGSNNKLRPIGVTSAI